MVIISAVPITWVLIANGIEFLPSITVGLLTGLYAVMAYFSEDYKWLRWVCAIIGLALAVALSIKAGFVLSTTIIVSILGGVLGYFARKWIEIIFHATP